MLFPRHICIPNLSWALDLWIPLSLRSLKPCAQPRHPPQLFHITSAWARPMDFSFYVPPFLFSLPPTSRTSSFPVLQLKGSFQKLKVINQMHLFCLTILQWLPMALRGTLMCNISVDCLVWPTWVSTCGFFPSHHPLLSFSYPSGHP